MGMLKTVQSTRHRRCRSPFTSDVALQEVPNGLVKTALDFELAEGTVVADTVAGTPCIFLGGLYRAERAIGERFLKIAGGRLPWPDMDAGKALPWVEGKTGLSLAASQPMRFAWP